MQVKCLDQEHNPIFPASVQTLIPLSKEIALLGKHTAIPCSYMLVVKDVNEIICL